MSETKTERRCPCGDPLPDNDPRRSYCSNPCRVKYGRFGRSYGTVIPRHFGWTKS